MNFRVDDKVVLFGRGSERFPGVWAVAKVNPVNYKLEQDGSYVNAPKSRVRAATAADQDQIIPVRTLLDPGQAVVVVNTSPRAAKYADTIFVVLADKSLGGGRVNAAPLGGRGGRYTRFPRSWLNPVEVTVSVKS